MHDPIQLELFKNRFVSVAEEMGTVLRRTSYSPNIKERLDFSCALFDASGQMIAQAAHIPVHLGAMPVSVKTAIERLTFVPGDVVILNDLWAKFDIVINWKYAVVILNDLWSDLTLLLHGNIMLSFLITFELHLTLL